MPSAEEDEADNDLANDEGSDEDEREREDPALQLILRLATNDPLLAVPPRLLVEIEAGSVDALLRKRLILLLSAVMKRHPLFRDDDLQQCLVARPAERTGTFETLRAAATRARADEIGTREKQLKPAEREKLVANAVTSLALVLSLRDRWTNEEFIECLDTHLWQRARTATGGRRPKALVADSRTPDALGVVADAFAAQARRAESQAQDHQRHAEAAGRRAVAAERLVEELQEQLEARAAEITTILSRVAELNNELDAERRSRLVDRSHHVDDYDSLRTRVIRMLDKQTDLLSDGLHALQNGSTGVTEEYLDRALVAFSRELENLKKEEGGS